MKAHLSTAGLVHDRRDLREGFMGCMEDKLQLSFGLEGKVILNRNPEM